MKKVFSVMLAASVLTVLLPATAMAHGHGGHRNSQRQCYAVCSVEDCTYTKNHEHDGVNYSAHYARDGHAYHNQDNNTYNGHNGNGCH